MEQLKEQLTTALSEKNAAIVKAAELQSEVAYYHTMLEKIDKAMQSINKLETSVRQETKTKIANMIHDHTASLAATRRELQQKHEQLLVARTLTSDLSARLTAANERADGQTRKVVAVMGELVNTALRLDAAERRLAALDRPPARLPGGQPTRRRE
ncbi:hypothetical protein NpNSSI1_00010895 [Neofusicoccum parvum]|nr:hypothetical protein NpNSSI1_00010895 [Neofusicoccum parvum]